MIVIVAGFVFVRENSNEQGANATTGGSILDGEVQKITLGMRNYNYYPNTVKVKEGVPLEITLDSSVSGCYRSLVIDEFDVAKYSANPSKTITFTPDKKGEFRFACNMGMGHGTLIVE
jgi:plastocyanin domain-containing protein